MSTNAQDGMAHVDSAQKLAKRGDFLTAHRYWTDACNSLVAAKKAGEHKTAAEYDQGLRQALKLLDDYGQAMARACAESKKQEAAEAELLRLRALVEEIKQAGENG